MNRTNHLSPRGPRYVWGIALTLGCAVAIGCTGAETQSLHPTTPTPPMPAPAETASPAQPKAQGPYGIEDWWPNQLDLRPLKANAPKNDPTDPTFDYAAAFSKLDLVAVKKDIQKTLTTSQDWWPADHGAYFGLMIRLAWHSAGTYRVTDGRGGAGAGIIRFAPLNSWPDNANLDKARRLLWPIKKKYGRSLSWADLMVLSGNVALESAGFKTFGFAGGREDVFEPTDINWGPETEWLAADRMTADGKLKGPVGATQMGLIYVNPEGPGGVADPKAAAKHIREAFARMAMNDEETVALIAGGHTLGKTHGAAKAADCVGPEPEAAPIEEQGLGWKNRCGSGKGSATVTSGLEGAWTNTPAAWSHGFFQNLFENEWELTKSPGGAQQWVPKGGKEKETVPDAHEAGKFHKPVMLTTDLSLREDPDYRKISERFYKNPKEFEDAFARAWFKLTHRDMGPRSRMLGVSVPPPQLWQDPLPAIDYKLVGDADVATLRKQILESGLTTQQLVEVAWASASSYRDTDMRGGANGARVRLAPQKDWAVNRPADLAKTIAKLEELQTKFNKSAPGGKKISLADLIVLAGNTAIEEAAKKAGVTIKIPFTPGRADATQELTDVSSFQTLESEADGFRNYVKAGSTRTPAELLVDKADMLALSAPEMTVLVAGMRVLDANFDHSKNGVFTARPGTLTNDFFVNLLDMDVEWKKSATNELVYEGHDRKTGAVKWTGTAVDLVFGANSQLRALSEVYAADDAKEKFVKDFASAWTKVMSLDRFDLKTKR
jgi:catalase-peroxidase